MSEPSAPHLRALWIGAAVFVAGIVRDLIWHAGHDEFEGTSQQVEAHWLLWIGFVIVLGSTVLAFLRLRPEERHRGFALVLAVSAVYLPVTVWHFVAHANDVDPAVAHVILGIGDVAIIAAAAWTFRTWLRRRPSSPGV